QESYLGPVAWCRLDGAPGCDGFEVVQRVEDARRRQLQHVSKQLTRRRELRRADLQLLELRVQLPQPRNQFGDGSAGHEVAFRATNMCLALWLPRGRPHLSHTSTGSENAPTGSSAEAG